MTIALKARGLQSPYLKNFVVARINFLRFKKEGPVEFEPTVARARDASIDSASRLPSPRAPSVRRRSLCRG